MFTLQKIMMRFTRLHFQKSDFFMENLEPHEFTTQNTVRTTAVWPVIETKLIYIYLCKECANCN